ncbi:MAG: ABC transporter substrate-binding protein [Anaerolineae bacterium]|nr:ABC transporter substrate-binding protein [Anaerolineae bacterium]
MRKRSSLAGFALFLLTVVMVFALSIASTGAQDATPIPEPTAIVSDLGTGSMKISFWNGLTGSDGVTLNDMLAQFVTENPDISVTTEIIPWNTLYTKLQTAFVAGTPPDVFMLHASEIPQFASYGVLKDVSGWYDTNGGWFPWDDISPTTQAGMIFDGVTYGIPLDNHGRGLFINEGAFEKAGVDPNVAPPTTFEGWVELFQQLTLDVNGNNAASPDFDKENVAQWGFAVGEWPRVNFLAALAQHGGSMISEDGTTVTVNSEAGVAALQNFIDLVYTYNVSPPEAGFDTWQGFAAGAVAVLPSGTWFRNFAAEQTDIEWAAWPQFQFGPGQGTWFGAHTWMLPVGLEGEKLDAVQTLIQWVSDNQVAWAASGQVPARLSAQAALDPENYPSNIILGETFGAYGVQDIQHVAVQEMYAALDPELSAALNNQKTAEQALNDAAARMQQVLDRNR